MFEEKVKMRGNFLKDETAQSMTEYILLIFLIAIVAFFGVRMYGGKIKKGFTVGADMLKNAK